MKGDMANAVIIQASVNILISFLGVNANSIRSGLIIRILMLDLVASWSVPHHIKAISNPPNPPSMNQILSYHFKNFSILAVLRPKNNRSSKGKEPTLGWGYRWPAKKPKLADVKFGRMSGPN